MKILECSSKGDKRFSALYAKIHVNGVFDSIENHYQKSKVFKEGNNLVQCNTAKEAKGKCPVAFNISGYYLPLRFGAMYYSLLWYKYLNLKDNSSLYKVLEQYDDYNDVFKSKTAHVCQADVIREYMKDKGKSLYRACKELLDILNKKNSVIIENGDALFNYTHIVAHQVNCQGVMGSGIAKCIKENYTNAYSEYIKNPLMKNREVLGSCQIVDCNFKIVANLYSQFSYGRNKGTVYTDYKALKTAMSKLKEYAKENKLVVAMPYQIGCGLANGDWNVVSHMIKDIFKDYYVILYKL